MKICMTKRSEGTEGGFVMNRNYNFEHSNFGLVSNFGFRASDLNCIRQMKIPINKHSTGEEI